MRKLLLLFPPALRLPPLPEVNVFIISSSLGFTVDRQSGHVMLDLSHASIHCA
ncbi:hypothetical protein HanRHA438_Chr00c06g0845831 [Helianthus annuus]|nr:hypothetical protein HanRHA438_Chr00c06g0845831 [Helianthus annuus]